MFSGILTLVFQNNLRNQALTDIRNIQSFYNSLVEADIKMLASALNTFSKNAAMRNTFVKHNRDELFAACNDLFTDNRDSFGITHFYFIDNDGTCFLRMHKRDLYGELIDRKTFAYAKTTGNVGSGIELGQTAYALRVVMPYKDGNSTVGYVEFGEEIEHFDGVIKQATGADVVVVADKSLLDRQKYTDVRTRAGKPDEWNDLDKYVVMHDTLDQHNFFVRQVFDAAAAANVTEPTYLGNIQNGDKVLMTGIFPFYDFNHRKTGVVWVLLDISDQIRQFWWSLAGTIGIAVLVLGIFLILALHSLRVKVINPLIKLTALAETISKGEELNHELITDRTDEIGMLTKAFDRMRISHNKLIKRLLANR
ncbi:hypothetical protein TI04_00840 [Achromatium sp. WMS2]|nr:hypothetical protein TI04_00840 [Achromatium sp. WMS2]